MIRLVDFLEVMANQDYCEYYYWGNRHTVEDLRTCYSTETYYDIIVTYIHNFEDGTIQVYLEDKS